MQDQDLVDAFFAVVPGGTVFQKAAGDLLRTPDARSARREVPQRLEWLTEEAEQIKANLELLVKRLEQRDQPTRDGIEAILNKLDEASRVTADPAKRRLLRHAAVNAFDYDLYWKGETLALLELLRDMTYGDIACLRQIAEQPGARAFNKAFTLPEGTQWWGAHEMTHHARRLAQQNLIVSKQPGQTVTMAATEEGWMDGTAVLLATSRGRLLLKLVADPNEPANESKSG